MGKDPLSQDSKMGEAGSIGRKSQEKQKKLLGEAGNPRESRNTLEKSRNRQESWSWKPDPHTWCFVGTEKDSQDTWCPHPKEDDLP